MATRSPAGVSTDALLRPEDLTIEVDPDAKDFVIHKSFLGATTRLVVQVGEIPVRVDVRSDIAVDIELGTRVRPTIISSDVLVASRVASEAATSAGSLRHSLSRTCCHPLIVPAEIGQRLAGFQCRGQQPSRGGRVIEVDEVGRPLHRAGGSAVSVPAQHADDAA